MDRLLTATSFLQGRTATRPMAWSFMRGCTAQRVTNLSRRKRRKFKVFELTFSFEASVMLCKSWKENAAGGSSLVLTASWAEGCCSSRSAHGVIGHASTPVGSYSVNMHVVFRKKCCFFGKEGAVIWAKRLHHLTLLVADSLPAIAAI